MSGNYFPGLNPPSGIVKDDAFAAKVMGAVALIGPPVHGGTVEYCEKLKEHGVDPLRAFSPIIGPLSGSYSCISPEVAPQPTPSQIEIIAEHEADIQIEKTISNIVQCGFTVAQNPIAKAAFEELHKDYKQRVIRMLGY